MKGALSSVWFTSLEYLSESMRTLQSHERVPSCHLHRNFEASGARIIVKRLGEISILKHVSLGAAHVAGFNCMCSNNRSA